MRDENAFTVEGVVTEVLSERTCRSKLANGHVVFGFLRAHDSGKVELVKGKAVVLKLSPFDLSEGQILVD
jgi:translation initiation factor IF-1